MKECRGIRERVRRSLYQVPINVGCILGGFGAEAENLARIALVGIILCIIPFWCVFGRGKEREASGFLYNKSGF